jgi:hypothetical protein
MSSTGALHTPDRERTATRLPEASTKASFDPLVDIDWTAVTARRGDRK